MEKFIAPETEMTINVVVQWGVASNLRQSQDEVRAVLSRALATYGLDYRFDFQTVPGNRILVTYGVLDSRIGPYPIARAADGINAAVGALRWNLRETQRNAKDSPIAMP